MFCTPYLPQAHFWTATVVAAAPIAKSDAWKIGILVVALTWIPLMLVGLYLVWRDKKRTQSLQKIADGLGFEFFPAGNPEYFASVARLELFSRGSDKKLWNLMRGTSRSFEVGIFDYKYTKGTGKQSRTWKQTVICLQSPALRLPDFMLSPKSFWSMVGAVFGHSDIRIEGRALFSKIYVLRGSDPDAIGRTFTDATLEFFEEHPGLSSQGANDRLLLYKTDKRVSPDDIPALLEDGLNLLSLMQSS